MSTSNSRALVCFVSLVLALASIAGAERGREPPLVLAEYHVWHGLPSHSEAFSGAFWLPHSRPYDSRDPLVSARHVARAKAMGIDGFVVDWYGPPGGVSNSDERAFMDAATATLLSEAEAQGLRIALLYDEGTVRQAESSTAAYEARVISDLTWAERYFSSPAYLRLRGDPALFVFPYPDVDPYIDWSRVRQALSQPVTLIDQDPNPDDPGHDDDFDGFFAWVQPSGGVWDPRGADWGKRYLKWFYSTMHSTLYRDKIVVGGAWPGFDDSLAPWGSSRYMSRRNGTVFDRTWRLANRKKAAIVLIGTWNDFEEGTDIEFGVRMAVDLELSAPEILMRSSPLEVVWNRARGEGVLQVYRDGQLIYDRRHVSGEYFALRSGVAYEIKLWADGLPEPLVQTVKIRAQDPISRVRPIVVD